MDAVEAKIAELERQIEEVEAEIKQARAQDDAEEVRQLRRKEEQLRREKEQLRTEKEQLRREKEQLREKELIALRASGASGSRSDSDASARDEMNRLLQRLEVIVKNQAVNSVDMSSAGCSVAEEVLGGLGFMQIDSSMLPDASPPRILPGFGNYPAFPMHTYPNEPAATGPYVKYLQEALHNGTVTMGKGGMAVTDIRKEVFLKLHSISATFNGFMDVGVHPAHVMGASILNDLEAGVELKHTQEQKKMYKAGRPARAQTPKVGGWA